MSVFLSKWKVILASGACQGFGSYQAARQSSPYITRAKHSSLFPLITLNPNPNLSSPLQSPDFKRRPTSHRRPCRGDPVGCDWAEANRRLRSGRGDSTLSKRRWGDVEANQCRQQQLHSGLHFSIFFVTGSSPCPRSPHRSRLPPVCCNQCNDCIYQAPTLHV